MAVRALLVAAAVGALTLTACTSDPQPAGPAGTSAASPARPTPARTADQFTPVTARPMGVSPQPVLGTDDRYHLVYEIELANAKLAPATLTRVEVLDAAAPSRVLASYSGSSLVDHLRTLRPSPADSARIEPNSGRILFVELSFATSDEVPGQLLHRFNLLGAANPGASVATPLDYTAAPLTVDTSPPPALGPPLAGDGWVAMNGCCTSGITHRGSVASVNGGLFDSQRFAIDYMRINAAGEFVHGDPSVVDNYVDYGAKVLAVADGTVVQVLDKLPDQLPGKLPDPADITLETVDGNNVVMDLGDGRYAFYAHLQKGSVTVHEGQHVTRGTVLGLLGNTGNTSAPHLHFHLMNGPSVLGSEGLPYVIPSFDLAGSALPLDGENLSGDRVSDRLASPVPERARYPLDLDIVNFPGDVRP